MTSDDSERARARIRKIAAQAMLAIPASRGVVREYVPRCACGGHMRVTPPFGILACEYCGAMRKP